MFIKAYFIIFLHQTASKSTEIVCPHGNQSYTHVIIVVHMYSACIREATSFQRSYCD